MLRLMMFLFALAAAPNLAAACGGPDEPCILGDRTYHIATPEGPGPHPALIFMHGYGGTGKGVIRNTGLVNQALSRGYAVIAPQGLPRPGSRTNSWNSFGIAERVDDVAYIRAVASDAATRFGLDRARMVLSGFSGGGMMVWRIACDQPDSFAVYAPVSGLLWRPLPARCAGPFRMLHTHGWADPVVPLEGRAVAGGRIVQGDLWKGMKMLRDTMDCPDKPEAFATEAGYMRRTWTACAPGAWLEVALFDGGHKIPKGWVGMALTFLEQFEMAQKDRAG